MNNPEMDLRALSDAASPGPWQWLDGDGESYDELQDGRGEQIATGFREDIVLDGRPINRDGSFAAAAANYIRAALEVMTEPQTEAGRALLAWDPEEGRGEEAMTELHGDDYTERSVILAIERQAADAALQIAYDLGDELDSNHARWCAVTAAEKVGVSIRVHNDSSEPPRNVNEDRIAALEKERDEAADAALAALAETVAGLPSEESKRGWPARRDVVPRKAVLDAIATARKETK